MIQIKFEVEEQEETPLPIESENERIKTLLSLRFFGNNLDNSNNVGGGSTSDTNDGNNVCGTLKQKSPEKIDVMQKRVVPKKKPKQLDNSTTNSVAAFVGCSKSIKTEPVESSLSLTTQLNNSLNIQSLLKQNRIQNGWTTNLEQSIPIGTQQQQQSFFLPKIEPIVSEIYQEVPLSLDVISALIPNLDSDETSNCDTLEVPLLDQSYSSIPNRTQQQKQQSIFLPKIEPIISENHQEILLSLDQSFSLNPNLNSNSGESTTTANCDITTNREIFGPRAGFGRRAKLNVCYSVPKKPNQFTTTTAIQINSDSADNLESTNNDDNYSDQDFISDFGSISGVDPSSSTAPSLPPETTAVPLLVGKKQLPLGIPPLTLEEKKALKRETSRLWYHRNKANPMKQPVDPKIKAEKLRRSREYQRKVRQQRLTSATPEQRELIRLKELQFARRQLEDETEEQRQRRLERMRQYNRTGRKQKIEQILANATPEQREQRRLKVRERFRRHRENQTEEQRQRRLERQRQYNRTVGNPRREQLLASATPEQREQMRLKDLEKYRRRMEKETEEQRQRRLERKRQYNRTVAKQRKKTETENYDTGREGKGESQESEEIQKQKVDKQQSLEEQMEFEQTSISTSTSLSLVVDNSESSTTTSTKKEEITKKNVLNYRLLNQQHFGRITKTRTIEVTRSICQKVPKIFEIENIFGTFH